MNPMLRIGHLNCRRLWRIWTVFIIVLLYSYSIYHSIMLYIELKTNSLDMAYGQNYNAYLLNFMLSCIIGGIATILLSIYCLLFYTGNLTDDGIRLGSDECPDITWFIMSQSTNHCYCHQVDNEQFINDNSPLYHQNHPRKAVCHLKQLYRRFKLNFLPFSSLLHVLSAYCLVIPLPFVEAQQIKLRVIEPKAIWHTDLDFLFQPDQWHQSFLFQVQSPSANSFLTFNQNSAANWPIRPQYFNLIASLVMLSIRYATVFWYSNQIFAFIFSAIMILGSLHLIIDFSASSILIRLFFNRNFVSSKLQTDLVSPVGLMALYITGSLLFIASFWCIFEVGIQQYIRNNYAMTNNPNKTHIHGNTDSIARANCCHQPTQDINHSTKFIPKRSYTPHCLAIVTCLVVVSVKTVPIVILGLYQVYKYSPDPLLLVNVVLSAILLVVWMIAWFGYALKPSWRFTGPVYSKAVSEISSVTNNNQFSSGCGGNQIVHRSSLTSGTNYNNQLVNSNSSTQVYSCFHDSTIGLIQAQQSTGQMDEGMSGPGGTNSLQRREYFMDANGNIEMENCTTSPTANYVYLQSAMNQQIPYLPEVDENGINLNGGIINQGMLMNTMDRQQISQDTVQQQQQQQGNCMISTHHPIQSSSAGVSESDSSYDSASNIRNQLLLSSTNNTNDCSTLPNSQNNSLLYRNQHEISGSLRNNNILKYVNHSNTLVGNSGANLRYVSTSPTTSCNPASKQTAQVLSATEYIQMQNSSATPSTINTNTPTPQLISNDASDGSSTMVNGGNNALQRQNSKKKLFVQRVTFKDDSHLQDLAPISPNTPTSSSNPIVTTEKSPNNSEHDSNNTTSSDSGIDSTSKIQQQQQQQRNMSFSFTNTQAPTNVQQRSSSVTPIHPYNKSSKPTNYPLHQTSACTSPPLQIDNTYYNFFTPPTTSSQSSNTLVATTQIHSSSNKNDGAVSGSGESGGLDSKQTNNNSHNNNNNNNNNNSNNNSNNSTQMDAESFMSDNTEQDRLCSQV